MRMCMRCVLRDGPQYYIRPRDGLHLMRWVLCCDVLCCDVMCCDAWCGARGVGVGVGAVFGIGYSIRVRQKSWGTDGWRILPNYDAWVEAHCLVTDGLSFTIQQYYHARKFTSHTP
jgi:hypothetical protein